MTGMTDVLEDVLKYPERTIVLTGPARSGKTSVALELYRQWLGPLGKAGCLMLVPNLSAAYHLRQRLLEQSPSGSIVSPAIITFSALAGSILSSAGLSPTMLSKVQRWLALERIVAELHAEGQLRAISPVVGSAGLTSVLDATIAELKRAAVEPDALERAIETSSTSIDLLKIYRRYQQFLRRTNAVDIEGRMWLARDILTNDPAASIGYENISAIVADGFTDFTPTQLEILARLSRRMDKVLITLPLDKSDNRERLWFWTERTLERIKDAIPEARLVSIHSNGRGPLGTLFDLSSMPISGTDDSARPAKTGLESTQPGRQATHRDQEFSITIIEAPDIDAEVGAIARAVKADLANGTRSIGIIARELQAYSEPIERIFPLTGIDVARRNVPLDRSGIVRYILRLISLPEKYESRDVLAVLKNSYFNPAALSQQFDASTVTTAQFAIGAANVLGGRQTYRKALLALKQQAQAALEEGDEEFQLGTMLSNADAIVKAAELLDALMDRVDKLTRTGNDMHRYVETVRELIDDFGIVQAILDLNDETLISAELRGLKAFDDLLEELSSSDLPAGTTPADLLKRACKIACYNPSRGPGTVTVLDALDARSLRFERVYLLGVNERVFPQLQPDRCFITEADRTNWAEKGVKLDLRHDLLGREMLLFYLSATRADKKLTVSCVWSEGSGERISSPSVFLDDLMLASEREGLRITKKRISPGELIPPPKQIATADNLFAAAIDALFTDSDQAGELLLWTLQNRPQTLKRACFGLSAWHNRWNTPEINAFDGRLDDAGLKKYISEKIPDKWVFSASELNSYASCPWSFLARYLLDLAAVSEPELLLAPELRGIFCHEVLRQVMTSLAEQFGRPVRLDEIDQKTIRTELTKAVEIERDRLALDLAHQKLWTAQTEYWKNLLESYLLEQKSSAQWQEGISSVGSMYFELAFGSGESSNRVDEQSRAEPIEITVPNGPDGKFTIRLAGRIDRVDKITAPDGKTSLLAVDYKTGRLSSRKDIEQARDLQLPLYIAALERMFDSICAGGIYHSLRKEEVRPFLIHPELVPHIQKNSGKADNKETFANIMTAIGNYIAAMRQGHFQALPADEHCPKWCPYRQICQYSARRAKWKSKDEQSA